MISSTHLQVADRAAPRLTIVLPCYNESAALERTVGQLGKLLARLVELEEIHADSRLFMVDDGSTDQTWQIIAALCAADLRCGGLRLTRNFGHQAALLAGLLAAPGDAVISMDADLQDDPDAVPAMLRAYREGADVVLAARSQRKVDGWFKRHTAGAYYQLLRRLGVDLVPHHADYRLLSRPALQALSGFREVNLFLRGLLPQLGFRQVVVYYERRSRVAGETKYSLEKMLALAVDGITSFSVAPLRLIAATGIVVFLVSLVLSCWALGTRLFTDQAIPGWASSVLPMYLLGGIQLLGIGVLGEYLAKVYMETKARPRFLIEETAGAATRAPDNPRLRGEPPTVALSDDG
jgi:polyisoprenyl-phosphate glycosyltransferase